MAILPLTVSAERFVRVLGEDAAITLFLELGGASAKFAAAPGEESQVVRVVGREAAIALHAEFGAETRRVPIPKSWIAQVWLARGLAVSEIARRLHVADKTVRGWTRAGRADEIRAAAERAERRAAAAEAQADLIDWLMGRAENR